MRQVASAAWHLVAIGYAAFVACSTEIPTGTDLWFFVFDVERLITPHSVGALAVVGAGLGGLTFAALTWRRRHIWMARLSWQLVGYMILCGIGLALLVLISQSPRYLARFGLSDLGGVAAELDVRHIIAYFAFAVIAAIAWRERVSLPVLGVLLMVYGHGLELVQEFIPSRNLRIKDLVSNGLGILLGLCWVHLYDSLLGEGSPVSRPAGRRRVPRSRSSTRLGVQPRQP